jgi:hypothetical protein
MRVDCAGVDLVSTQDVCDGQPREVCSGQEGKIVMAA